MLTNNRALILRDKSAPTVDEWREQKRREDEDRRWEGWKRARDAEMANQLWWGRLAALMVVATCVLAVAVVIDISREPQPADAVEQVSGSTPEPTATEPHSPFNDPSPITHEEIMPHQSRYGGFAILDTQTGYYTLPNLITGEEVTTVGELRRYQAMLDRRASQ